MPRQFPIVLAALTILIGAAESALAREPTAEERARIESVLRAEGFTRWDDIEFDDGKWEIDDAVDADGRTWDVDLDAAFKVISRKRD